MHLTSEKNHLNGIKFYYRLLQTSCVFLIDKPKKKVSQQVIKAPPVAPFQLGDLPLRGKRTAVRQRRLVRCAKARRARCVGDKESLDKTKREEQV